MRTVILGGLILLVLTVVESNSNYKFGDIISFPRKFARTSYKHFAVYVGPQMNLFDQGDKDLFHRIRKPIDGKYCAFGSLKNEPQHQKENYLDVKLNKLSDAEIIKRVKAMIQNCGHYSLLTNNCEHLATYVRYGKAYLKQPGTSVRFLCRFFPRKTCRAADEAVKKMKDEDPELQEILKKLDANSETEDQDVDAV